MKYIYLTLLLSALSTHAANNLYFEITSAEIPQENLQIHIGDKKHDFSHVFALDTLPEEVTISATIDGKEYETTMNALNNRRFQIYDFDPDEGTLLIEPIDAFDATDDL